jgi:hypothetical protein
MLRVRIVCKDSERSLDFYCGGLASAPGANHFYNAPNDEDRTQGSKGDAALSAEEHEFAGQSADDHDDSDDDFHHSFSFF